jgi:hypothetical protein
MDLQGDLFNFVHFIYSYMKVAALLIRITCMKLIVLFGFMRKNTYLLFSFPPYASTKFFVFICFILWNVDLLLGNDSETNN